jgi:diguanylate cyclase (GGDEF)-like protein
VARTQVHTIVPDVVGDCDWYREFSSDVYLQQHAPQSFLGLPLLKQQQLVGVLYLESQWVAHAFCAQRMKVLKFLASQAAIAIKTVGLYDQLKIYSQTLERKVAERTIALETANRQLHHLATIDGLTQTLNRRSFDETLEREWQRSRRQQHPLALILCDVDFFKPYNDCYGHQAGDDCLRQIAQRLHHTLKRAEDCLARYGGEEFAAILPDTDAAGAAHIANLMCQAVFDAAIPHAHSLVHGVVTVSIGVGSVIPSDINATPQHLVEDTDRALYRAKREGRNRYVVAELAL